VERSGSPTVGAALLRILYSIPSLVVLAIFVLVGAIVWLLGVVLVLVNERYPRKRLAVRARARPLGGVPARVPLLAERPLPAVQSRDKLSISTGAFGLATASTITCTKLAGASNGAAWPAPSIRCVLAVGMAAASERVNRHILSALRAPHVHTTGTSTAARSAADGYSPMELRKSVRAALAFSRPARRHSSGKASQALPPSRLA
jgi:hypothetical protein